jgi:acyl-CoA oxidase
VIFARLKIDENDYGVQPFVVQLRDLNTWKHLKGIQSGDMGPKFGYESKDNGWAIFDQVRIPRTNMLMGLAEVEKDGTFSIKKDMRVLYTTMMLIRLTIACDTVNILYASL